MWNKGKNLLWMDGCVLSTSHFHLAVFILKCGVKYFVHKHFSLVLLLHFFVFYFNNSIYQ